MAVIGFGGGFIIATTLLFAMTSAAFGRKALHIDLLIGFVLATVVYLSFHKILSLSLPAGRSNICSESRRHGSLHSR